MDTKTPERLLEALTVELSNLETYQSEIGFGAAELTECTQDRANLAAALDNADIVEADKKTVTQIKNAVYQGSPQGSVSAYPAFGITALPFPSVKAGALARYQNRRSRARLAAGYTQQIGIALGYETAPADPISNNNLTAAANFSDLGDYRIEVVFKKHRKSGMLVQMRLKGTEKWTWEKIALNSPFTFNVESLADEGAAVQIEARCRLLDGNDPVGNWSPIYALTVNP